MSVTDIVERPISAPITGESQLQNGFQQLLQYNASMQYQPNQYPYVNVSHIQSGSNTGFSSPTPSHLQYDQYERDQYHDGYQGQHDQGLGIRYDGYNTPMYYPNPQNMYPPIPSQHHQYHDSRIHMSAPPTPPASDQSHRGRRTTRGGRQLAPNGDTASVKAQHRRESNKSGSRPRRTTKQVKGDKPRTPKLSGPLSELTKDYDHIPIKDMDEWVNRPAETRRAEVEKRNGYVTRPMNSFMLYRSAFAERTKTWCLQNNHQVVSSVSGESWPLEPAGVRERYNEYARIERDNHQKAHPGYKFSPSKVSSGRKRKGPAEEQDDEELSDLDDTDYDWRPNGTRRTRPRQNKRPYIGGSFAHESISGVTMQRPQLPGFNPSSYEATNPGKPLPMPMTAEELYGQYYQTTIHPNASGPNIEDVLIKKTETPSVQYGLTGFPGAHHYDLLDQDEQFPQSNALDLGEPQVDPLLLEYDSSYLSQPGGLAMGHGFNDLNRDNFWNHEPPDSQHPSSEEWILGRDAEIPPDTLSSQEWLADFNGKQYN